MSNVRRALAVLPIAGLTLVMGSTASAQGPATVQTDACVRYVAGQPTMTIIGSGFTPGSFVRLGTATKANPQPSIFTSTTALPTGAIFKQTTPPSFRPFNRTLQSFTLVAQELNNPANVAITPFQVARFGMTTSPAPRRPAQRVTYTARGFEPGKRVYIHFRFGGITRRSVSLGVATGPCGTATRKMRALPTKARFGNWTTYTNQAQKFSINTRPAWKGGFRIFRTFS